MIIIFQLAGIAFIIWVIYMILYIYMATKINTEKLDEITKLLKDIRKEDNKQ